ncbi:Cof-type HAD-IIB family hydrolase [Clostridium brassicae]|uniref:Cof-type HAD-IIB family hydrolase n=1 Tax=Clostridium brassicae TaxID=2999072 RepID=A0ABT4D9R8_9CLOT|nr:Cof-type HAD-IIB family hydrolase [Clostridium brassicae]MCY6958913.1 Cof-type HAD-IIB family hydrolase [Clostridium brassicae]
MYRMIAIDMDGTLLRKDKSISHVTYEAIQKAKEKGVKIVLSTGRPVQGVSEALNFLDLNNKNTYIVSCSGALVQCASGEIISENNLSFDEVNYLYNLSKELNINLNAVTHNNFLTPSFNFTTEVEAYMTNMPVKVVDFENLDESIPINRIAFINETESFINRLKNILKYKKVDLKYDLQNISLSNKNDSLFSNKENLPKELYKKFTVLKPTSNTLEILNKNVNKGTGVASLAEKLGIKKEDIICIGDSGNDIHMLQYAGLGVAMGNAFPEVKSIADYVTLSNEEDGVAHVINKFILQE